MTSGDNAVSQFEDEEPIFNEFTTELEFGARYSTSWSDMLQRFSHSIESRRGDWVQDAPDSARLVEVSEQEQRRLAQAIIAEGRTQGVRVVINQESDHVEGVIHEETLRERWRHEQVRIALTMGRGVIVARADLERAICSILKKHSVTVRMNEQISVTVPAVELWYAFQSQPVHAWCLAVNLAKWCPELPGKATGVAGTKRSQSPVVETIERHALPVAAKGGWTC